MTTIRNATALCNRLALQEFNSANAPDCRRILSDERQSLHIAIESRDAARIRRTANEARRVAAMWGVEV